MRRLGQFLTITCVAAALLAHPGETSAASLPLQGALRTAGGGPVADGAYVIFVKLYDAADAQNYLWEDALTGVQVSGGLFHVVLGTNDAKPLADALLTSGAPLWIGVQVSSDPELSRRLLRSVPRAYYADMAAAGAFGYAASSLPGGPALALDCSGCVTATQIDDGAVTSTKVGFTYAGSDSKGGAALEAIHATAADTAKAAETAQTAVTAQTAQSAKIADAALVATTADEALGLQCTGCVGMKQLAADVANAYLATKGGTVSGDLGVDGKVTVGGGLALGTSVIEGGQLAANDIGKAPCDAQLAGRIAFDEPSGRLALCDGKIWRKLSFCSESCKPAGTVACGAEITDACGDTVGCEGKGTMCEGAKSCQAGQCVTVGKSCADILAQDPKAASGKYLVDPDGAGGLAAFETLCDMTSDGGGWTLLLRADGAKSTFQYDVPLWTDDKAYQENQVADASAEVKTLAAVTMPFTSLRIGLTVGADARWAKIDQAAASLTGLFKGGAVGTSLGRNGWKALMADASMQPHCNMEGFNRACGSRMVRVGFLTNQENDCNSCDSYLGIGHSGQVGCDSQTGTICGMMATCTPDNGIKSVAAWGFIYAR